MNGSEFLVYFIIIFLIVIIIVAVVIVTHFYNQATPSPNAVVTPGTFLAQCATAPNSCHTDAGLVCDGLSYQCKKDLGYPCTSAAECRTGLYCSGTCTGAPNGALYEPCPCNPGYGCDINLPYLHICKGQGGTTCRLDEDCLSNNCTNERCTSGIANGLLCSTNAQCSSGNCSDRFCQPPGVVTGSVGANCSGTCTAITGASCQSDLACSCSNGANEPGVCAATTAGILSFCSPTSNCTSELVCYENEADGLGTVRCNSGSTGCTCTFAYEDPNTPPAGVQCPDFMASNGTTCQNKSGLGCSASFNCASGLCSRGAVVTTYHFNGTATPTMFLGATSVTSAPIPSALTDWPDLKPRRFLAAFQGTFDNLVLVDPAVGLLRTQIDLTTGHYGPWILVMPSLPNREIWDASFNGISWLVVIRNTITGNSFDLVYSAPDLMANLSPFNVQPGVGVAGTQYTTNGSPIVIDYIDYSRPNTTSPGNDVLLTSGTAVYRKMSTEGLYTVPTIIGGANDGQPVTVITGPASFYYDNGENLSAPGPSVCPAVNLDHPIQCTSANNIAFINSYSVLPQILQFSGDIAGYIAPVDLFVTVDYEVYQYSIFSAGQISTNGIAATLSTIGGSTIDVLTLSEQGKTAVLPGWVGPQSLVAVGVSGIYLFSPASCA